MRDYIPEGEHMTRAERAAYDRLRSVVKGGVRNDFVPDKGDKLMPPAPNGAEVALERALAEQARAFAAEFTAAKARLAQLNIAECVQLIAELPPQRQEMFLLAEAVTGARQDITGLFPEPSDTVKALYLAPAETA